MIDLEDEIIRLQQATLWLYGNAPAVWGKLISSARIRLVPTRCTGVKVNRALRVYQEPRSDQRDQRLPEDGMGIH